MVSAKKYKHDISVSDRAAEMRPDLRKRLADSMPNRVARAEGLGATWSTPTPGEVVTLQQPLHVPALRLDRGCSPSTRRTAACQRLARRWKSSPS